MLTEIKVGIDLGIYKNTNIIMCDIVDGQISLLPYE